MKQKSHSLSIATKGQDFTDITEEAKSFVSKSGIEEGLLTLFLRHTSASLLIQENADPDVLADLLSFFSGIAPRDRSYRHRTEGPDDMPAHLRAALTQSNLSIPVFKGRLALGTWQAIYLFEHRDAAHRREILMHIIGA